MVNAAVLDTNDPLGKRLAEFAAEKAAATPPITDVVVDTPPAVTETVVDAPIDTTVVVDDTTPPEAKKNVLDMLADDGDDTLIQTNEPKAFKLEDLPTELKSDIELAQQIKNNPLFKLFENGADAETLREFAKSIIPQDNSNLPLSELVKMDFQNDLGLTGEDLTTAVEDYMAELESMQPYKQKKAEKDLRDKFKPAQIDPNGFLKQWNEQQEKNKTPQQPTLSQEEFNAFVEADKNQLSEFSRNLIGGEFNGVEITEAEVAELVNKYDPNEVAYKYLKKDGSFNTKKFVQDKLATDEKIIEKRIQKAIEKEKSNWLKEYGGVDKTANNGADFGQGKSPINQTKAALEFMLGKTITT